jgi:KAP family P-loop domain
MYDNDNQRGSMAREVSKGYDSALNLREEDDLDRWRFAAEIAEMIASTPVDWSARCGVFARWGEGKTTVLRFLERMLEEQESIVLWFNPWASQSFDDLMNEFGDRLLETLSAKGLAVESPMKRLFRKAEQKLEGGAASVLAGGAADAFHVEKLYSGSVAVVSDWLRLDGPQVQKLREQLKERRIVVLIDDLDRCAPLLLPKLLLSLRELLDIPGFTFILAFDDEIVAKALVEMNPAWGEGGKFLDKILDFQYHLSPMSNVGKSRLISKAMGQHCPFVPKESTAEIEDLLPDNPRKLKALVRGIATLKPQISRHNEDELNWIDIWLAQLIRGESYPFFERLLEGDTLEKEIGAGFRVSQSSSRPKFLDKAEDKNTGVKRIIEAVGISDPAQTATLIHLVEGARSRSSLLQLRYNWELTRRPHAITWKEFGGLMEKWRVESRETTITEWIAQHSAHRSETRDRVEDELFITLILARDSQISSAINADTTEDLTQFCREAELLLEMTQQFLSIPKMLTPNRFKELHKKALYWIGFRKNVAERQLRQREKAALISLIDSASPDLSSGLLEAMKPWDPWARMGDGPEVVSLKKSLLSTCTKRLARNVSRHLFNFLNDRQSIRRLGEPKRFLAYKYLLFHPDSIPWGKRLRSEIYAMLKRARRNLDAFENACALLRLLTDALEYPDGDIGSEGVQMLIHDHKFIRSLWNAVLSRRIQWRLQVNFLTHRARLMKAGVPNSEMPISKALEERVPEVPG